MSSISAVTQNLYVEPASLKSAKAPEPITDTTENTGDSVRLSLAGIRTILQAGRIEMNERAGRITPDQADELNQQYQAINDQISAFHEANGGEPLSSEQARTINEMQNTLSQAIHSMATSSDDNTSMLLNS